MSEIGFSLGSNLGDKQGTIERALDALFGAGKISFLAASSFYRTAPWGNVDQDWFVNVCAVGDTRLAPAEVLAFVKTIEQQLGRTETVRWGPRIIDIDILWQEGETVAEPGLVVPHRELFNRAFVLTPLAEIRPDLVIAGRRIGDAAAALDADDLSIVAGPWSPSR